MPANFAIGQLTVDFPALRTGMGRPQPLSNSQKAAQALLSEGFAACQRRPDTGWRAQKLHT